MLIVATPTPSHVTITRERDIRLELARHPDPFVVSDSGEFAVRPLFDEDKAATVARGEGEGWTEGEEFGGVPEARGSVDLKRGLGR